MKRLFSCIAGAFAALIHCSCATTFQPTRNLADALAKVDADIVFQDRAYMEKQTLLPPSIPDLENLGVLKFLVGFEQYRSEGNKKFDVNQLTPREFDIFKAEFENAIAGSRRFSIATLRHGLADKRIRLETRAGGNAAAAFGSAKLAKVAGILNIRPALTVSESLVGREKTVTNTFSITCSPLDPRNNQPLDDFDPFRVYIDSQIFQLTDRFGRTVAGFRFNTPKQLEDDHLRQGRAVIARFFARIYKMFPVGGKVTSINEDGGVALMASRQNGLLPKMECIIFAVKKGSNGEKLPLYNATAVSVAQKGVSTLQIWRKSDRKLSKKIIKMIEKDFDEAREEYDFYAASSGFAEWPDFLDKPGAMKK